MRHASSLRSWPATFRASLNSGVGQIKKASAGKQRQMNPELKLLRDKTITSIEKEENTWIIIFEIIPRLKVSNRGGISSPLG
jgi:hypothetical protein